MIILQPHWCPNCRVMQEEWRVPASGLKRKKIRPGDPWPTLEPIHTEAVDKCESCGKVYYGQIKIKIDENGEPEKIFGVKELEI